MQGQIINRTRVCGLKFQKICCKVYNSNKFLQKCIELIITSQNLNVMSHEWFQNVSHSYKPFDEVR